jgi:RNA polymerase sigma-70 factor (ECF subfamily)
MNISINPPILSLIRADQAGDRDAFQELYTQHVRMVFRTAYLMLGDYELAEELTQDAFMRVYDRLERYGFIKE